MRTYGRVTNPDGSKTWVQVNTDANGFNDQVYLTALAQVLKLNLGESPFYANYGIPQVQTILTQVFPDYYIMQAQSQFARYFASLTINRVSGTLEPVYNVQAVTNFGSTLGANIPI